MSRDYDLISGSQTGFEFQDRSGNVELFKNTWVLQDSNDGLSSINDIVANIVQFILFLNPYIYTIFE